MENTKSNTVGDSPRRSAFTRRQTISALGITMGVGLMAGAAAEETRDTKHGGGIGTYDIRTFGAKGDGVTADTKALQAAIDACAADGGGIVEIPAGVWLIGTAELKSNVTLRIAAGGKLLGSGKGADYHAVNAIPLHGDSTLEDGNWALLYAVEAKNVTIEGPGTIDGQGAQFHSPVRGTPPPSGIGGNKRPYHLLFYRCENLRVRDLTLVDCAYHSIRVIQSKRVFVDGVYIHNRVNGNNDGFHFISAEHVAISNCTVLSLDDACALFGSCRDVTVTNSYFSTRWSVFRFGGGNAANIAVSNCVLHQVYGCPIKFHGTPGSSFENMSFSNLVLDDVTGPIHFSIGPRMPRRSHSGPTPVDALPEATNEPPAMVRNIAFSNIHGTVTTNPGQMEETTLTSHYNPGEKHSCITLSAVAGAILEHVSFENIHLVFGGDGTAEDAARRQLPEIAGEYFMLGPMPAYGFYARNSRAITLSDVRFETATPDLRPALVLDHVTDATINGLNVQGNLNAESALRFIDAQRVLLNAPRLLAAAKVYLQVEGKSSARIIVDGGDLSDAVEALAFRDGADSAAVKLNGQ
ncbi:MAG: glycoside hydrolase family 28 protein [Acidobacteriota bacterium]